MKRTAFFLLMILYLAGCSSEKIKPGMTQMDRFELAKRLIKKKKYLQAKIILETMTSLNIVNNVADSTQFYLAEIYFNREEYITAIGEYQRLIREYPNSKLVDDAQFKVGLCYYKISPAYNLDQEYTKKAVDEFQKFLENFPNSNLVPEALKKLRELIDKLARKDYEIGKQYKKLKEYNAALIYFNFVIQNYQESKYTVDSYYQKGECLYKLKRYREAKEIFENFIRRFSDNPLAKKAREFLDKINNSSLVTDAKEN